MHSRLPGLRPRARLLSWSVLGLLLALGTALPAPTLQGQPHAIAAAGEPAALPGAAPTAERSLRDLGNVLCAAYAPYCADIWRQKMEFGLPFNLLISEICLHIRILEHEDAGIACLETALRIAASLPEGVLVDQQFGPGERSRNALWHDKTDRQWRDAAERYFKRIPVYCDHATPVIFDYFPCLLRETQFFQTFLKRYRMR